MRVKYLVDLGTRAFTPVPMKKTRVASLVALFILFQSCWQKPAEDGSADIVSLKEWNLSEIRVRDPFILRDDDSEMYYLYAQKENRMLKDVSDTLAGVEAYISRDLLTWYGPRDVFIMPEGFWADYQVWAPEVHEYNDRFYLFVTLSSHDTLPDISPVGMRLPRRGTQILEGEGPLGPFSPFENKPHTPVEWSSLDGTLWVEDGVPYMIFCHEWTQIGNGSVELVQLAEDLSGPVSEPQTLFHAGDAEWVRGLRNDGKVTDGCFIYRAEDNRLIMIWSSFGDKEYAIGTAISENGKISGPWIQSDLLFDENGGHGMIVKSFEGELLLVFHQPNRGPEERAQFYRLKETNARLERGEQFFPSSH